MTFDEICWATTDREDLLDALLGEHQPSNLDFRIQPDIDSRGIRLGLGYRRVRGGGSFSVPSLIIIPDGTATETLSWLRTFADEASPLSQYGRVVLASEWSQFKMRRDSFSLGEQRPDRWSSIIVGEALSQIEGETSLLNLPLSRFSGCFTTPIARAALIWESDDATYTCTNRLRQLESDRRFARRSVGVEHLLPVWAIANARITENLPPSEAANYVLSAAAEYFRARDSKVDPLASLLILKQGLGLSSDSIEERVGAFNQLASNILQRVQSERGTLPSALDSPLLAAAAFLVGRGTSHIFLLQRVQGFAPTAATWFGAMAALAGPRTWDKAWLKAAKGAERLLRPEFNWLETSGADICWAEFEWMAETFDSQDVFLELPKMLPRTLGIEIVPGAVGQFRLAGASAENEPKPQQFSLHSVRERALMETVAQFINLAQRVKDQVDQSFLASGGQPVQKSFGFDGDVGAEKPPRAKKSKRNANNP